MSIGKKEIFYTLTDTDDESKIYKFKFCKCHATIDSTGKYHFFCDELGDDILDILSPIYKTNETYTKKFRFNSLEGCFLDIYFTPTGSATSTATMHIGDYVNNSEYTWSTYCEVAENRTGDSSPNNLYMRCGLMLGYLDNDLYTEGVSVIPFHVPARYAMWTVTKVNDFSLPYEQITTNSPAVQTGSGFVGNTWSGSNNYPTRYILKDYHLLSYSDSGDITKQRPLVISGFPYGDGESTSQGGQGEMTDTSDPIEIDSKPLLTTGDFLRVYRLTATDLSALQAKLISNGFLDNLIAKLRTDAMDYIVGLNAIPISAANVAASTIKIANLDTGINASYLSWYIEDIDFGEIALTEYFQTFMDYSPYTKLSVYIPYCGIVPLNVDNFMNDKISMKCRVDMLTGQFVVFVSNSVGVVTTVSGNCAYQLPIRANDYNRLVTSGLGLLGGIVGTAGALATGNIPLAVGAGLGTVGGLVATSQAMTKPDVTSKGSLGGNYGLLGNRTPYLIIQRPTISVPSDYGKTIGYMSRITAKLGDLTGYTVVEEIHLEHISATDDEKRLIENALKSGVIL